MIISYQWLQAYLPLELSIDELSKILTNIGLEVESVETIETVTGGLTGLIVGEVLKCQKHPNADKLNLTLVDIGNAEPLNIVCGAPNVAEGQKVIVATVGTKLFPKNGEPFVIAKAKIRGEESRGMICAEDEIGIGNAHDGILVLPEETPVGLSAAAYFKIPPPDYAIHIGLTPNRSDANSHLGVARDVCAWLSHHRKGDYKITEPALFEGAHPLEPGIHIEVKNTELCPRYAAVEIENLSDNPSPDWMQSRLKTIGLKPVNALVDVTNFVLHEMGQPLHAFDKAHIEGQTIVVRQAVEQEKFIALDGQVRQLAASDLVIADKKTPLCLAGVFGGMDSGIQATTQKIFLESAWFEAATIRKTSLNYNLRTDAATHFEKGIDPEKVTVALKRALFLINDIFPESKCSPIEDLYPAPVQKIAFDVSLKHINKLCGKEFSLTSVMNLLTAMDFKVEQKDDDRLHLEVPSYKQDIHQPADVIEEILRIDGLDIIRMPTQLTYTIPSSKKNPRRVFNHVADALVGLGFTEISTNSITHSARYPERQDLVKMINSLSSELDVLRPEMLNSGLEVVNYNVNRKQKDLALFELGKIYQAHPDFKFIESEVLSLWICGDYKKPSWKESATPADFYTLKSVVQNITSLLGLESLKYKVLKEESGLDIFYQKIKIGKIVEVSAQQLKLMDLKISVCYAELYWQKLIEILENQTIIYTEISPYPVVERDLALLVKREVSMAEIEAITKKQNLQPLKSFGLFDLYTGDKIDADKKSLALRFKFQLEDRTLTEKEIEQFMFKLVNAYQNELAAQIRD